MKKIFLILISFVTFTSCDDVIDIEQPGILTEDQAITSVDDFNSALFNSYNRLDNTTEILFNAGFTDELALGLVNGGQNRLLLEQQLNPNSGIPFTLWSNYYITINQVNKFLAAGDQLIIDSSDRSRFNEIKGEFLAIRAYCHFQLQTYFSTDLTDDTALGVIKLDKNPGISEFLPRNTNAEVFDFIEQDLDQAETLITTQSETNLISKDFITALKARMAAYRGQYTMADQYANALLNSYTLTNQIQFFNTFDDTDDSGVIFELDRIAGDIYDNQRTGGFGWAGSLFAFGGSTINGSPFMELSRSLYNSIDDADIRKLRLVDPSSRIDPNYTTSANPSESDVLVIRLYPGHSGQVLMNDLKIFRVAEILLLKIEAQIGLGNLPAAATLLKQLQDNRYPTPQPLQTFGSAQDAYRALLDERRKELALQGFRWVDIKRLGVLANTTIDRDVVDCAFNGVCTISNTDHRFTLPIPLREIDIAGDILEQNPGY